MLQLDENERAVLVGVAQGKRLDPIRKGMGIRSWKSFYKIVDRILEKTGASSLRHAASVAIIAQAFTLFEMLVIRGYNQEVDILRLVADDWRDADIEAHLKCSRQGIVQCLVWARKTTGVNSRQELGSWLKEEGSILA